MYTPGKPFEFTLGPRDAKVVLCAEAWGEIEDKFKRPLVGWSGLEMARVLHETGHVAEPPPLPMGNVVDSLRLIKWWGASGVLTTNVFAFRPPDNNLQHSSICGPKAEVKGNEYANLLPPLKVGKYIKPEYLGELARLSKELDFAPRNLILALGATATWALLHDTRIGKIRGAITEGRYLCAQGAKVLPTYHPAAILRQWALRPVLLADCLKAKHEREFAHIVRPHRWVIVDPTLAEVQEWTKLTLSTVRDKATGKVSPYSDILSVDIETKFGQIESIAFARTKSEMLTVPFIDRRAPGWSYWSSGDEVAAWGCVRALLESDIPKIFQNGLFDLNYIYRAGIRPRNCLHDTMLQHHALYPELTKGLGFLGSIYSNEAPWKLMRGRAQEGFKRDE